MFDEVYRKIDRVIDFFLSSPSLVSLSKTYKNRLLSMKSVDLSSTDFYSLKYFQYRLNKYGYTNKNHNYYLTGKFQNTLDFKFKNKSLILQTEADYFKYLYERFKHNVGLGSYDLEKVKEDLYNYLKNK